MAVEEQYRVFEDGVSRTLFAEIMTGMGFTRQDVWGGQDEAESYEEVWAPQDKLSAINYVEDNASRMTYACIRQQQGGDVVRLLGEKLALYPPDVLIEEALDDPEPDELVNTLYRLAITFPDYDETVANILGGAAQRHPDRNVRGAAMEAIAYRVWPELRGVLEGIAASEEDSGLRDHAAEILSRWPQ